MASMNERLHAYIASHGHHSSLPARRSPRGVDRSLISNFRRSASSELQGPTFNSDPRQTPPANADAALDAIVVAGRQHHSSQIAHEIGHRSRRASTSDASDGFNAITSPQHVRGNWQSLNPAQIQGPSVPSSGTDYPSERARYNKARIQRKGHDLQQTFDTTASTAPHTPTLSSSPGLHPHLKARRSPSPGRVHQATQESSARQQLLNDGTPSIPITAPHRQDELHQRRPRMSSTVDAFLGQILHSVSQRDGQRLTSFIVLDFDSLSEDRRQPYGDLHNELNQRYPAVKDAALSTKVKQALPADQLLSCHSAFTESIIQYFRYVRDYVNDSALLKARKMEKLTRQCIITLRDDQPGPIMIPLVLHLTSILRLVAINLDRDPALTAQSASAATDDEGNISFVENTGNVLREAFNKCIQRSRPTQPPTPNSLSSGLYLILNSCMSLYNRAGKLRNAEFLLGTLDKTSPPLTYYPASQRVTYLYFLGKFHFSSNHFYRAITALQSAYDQCAKNAPCMKQRRLILIHLIAASLCVGRLPNRILIVDQAAHSISKPFLELSRIIQSGDIGRFHTHLDYTLPSNTSAQWLLKRGILLQLRNRCEVLCWRSLILRAMRHAGFLGSAERQGSMPYVRFKAISNAAHFSYARARQDVARHSNSSISIDEQENDYVDPDFAELGHDDEHEHEYDNENDSASTPGLGQSPTTALSDPNPNLDPDSSFPSHLPLPLPTPPEINTITLSLISQGLLRGFVSHSHPDLLQSRFAIPGVSVRGRPSDFVSASASAWRDVGFPRVWDVVRARAREGAEVGVGDGNGDLVGDGGIDVPGWVTGEKVRRREEERAKGGGGRVIRITTAKPVGS